MARRFNRYVLGYDQDRQTVYGKEENGKLMFADPMTLRLALAQQKKLNADGVLTIYKFVPVRTSKQ